MAEKWSRMITAEANSAMIAAYHETSLRVTDATRCIQIHLHLGGERRRAYPNSSSSPLQYNYFGALMRSVGQLEKSLGQRGNQHIQMSEESWLTQADFVWEWRKPEILETIKVASFVSGLVQIWAFQAFLLISSFFWYALSGVSPYLDRRVP